MRWVAGVCFAVLLWFGWYWSSLKSAAPPDVPGIIVLDHTRGRVNVRLVTLEDGTKCAVLLGLQRGAISCDWK